MKWLYQILTVVFLCTVLQLFLPWWSAAVAASAATLLFNEKPLRSFVLGFAGVSVVWITYCLWIDWQNSSILSSKIAVLFQVQKPVFLHLIAALIGGITGGLGGWMGSELRAFFRS
jgi:hypothetical protein